MKSAFILLLVLTFFGISTFGFWGMAHSNHGGNFWGCLASAIHGSVFCPENWLSEIEFHFSAIEFFSLAIVSASFIGMGLLLMSDRTEKDYLIPLSLFGFIGNLFFHSDSKASFIRWLSLHENSPSFKGPVIK